VSTVRAVLVDATAIVLWLQSERAQLTLFVSSVVTTRWTSSATSTTTMVRGRAFWSSVVALVVVSWLSRAATETGETSTLSSKWFEDSGATVARTSSTYVLEFGQLNNNIKYSALNP
jgi:hypothetical protein